MDVSMSALSMGSTFTAAPEETAVEEAAPEPSTEAMAAPQSTAFASEAAENPYAIDMSIMGDELPMKACLVDDPECESCQ